MSKTSRRFPLFLIAVLQILQIFSEAQAQTVEAKVTISSTAPTTALVAGRFLDDNKTGNRRNFSFMQSAAGTEGLAARISDVRLTNRHGSSVAYKQLIEGELLAESDFNRWSYSADLSPPKNQTAAAHVSWITADAGVVMLDDLLPQLPKGASARVILELPSGWEAFSAYAPDESGAFEIRNLSKAVFVLGRGWRKQVIKSGRTQIDLLVRGEWNFADGDLLNMAGEVFGEYRKIFGSEPAERVQIVISPFPVKAAHGRWQAETRGRNVLILSGDMAFKTQSLQRLHEQLRHEVFHLWLPNGVNLTGNYDWFYEGIALYQSLKLGTLVGRIRFEDFLDTLSRAYNIDKSQSRRIPLVNAAQNRWRGAGTQLYARGMLAAFLADVVMLRQSGGKRSITDVASTVYLEHRPPAEETDGNGAVIAVLQRYKELSPIVLRYIIGAEDIDWTAELAAAGIETTGEGFITLKTPEKPNGRQKAVLDKLGYNRWRKFAP